MIKLLTILLTLLPVIVYASSGETAHSPKELLGWSFFNFILLFGALGYFLKGKLSALFNKKQDEIKVIYSQAMEKQKHAQKERDNLQMEIANLSNFEDKVMKDTIGNTLKFKDSYTKEIDEKIIRVEHESSLKVENIKKLETYKIEIADIDKFVKGQPGKPHHDLCDAYWIACYAKNS